MANKPPAADVRASEEKTIFRANSIASKALDYYMKLVGMEYLFCELFALFPPTLQDD